MERTSSRKADHVRICLEEEVEVGGSGLDCVRFVHNPLPEIDRSEIDTSSKIMGKRLELPLLIGAMTGGYNGAGQLNRDLARAAQRHGIALGLGSMRAMIEDRSLDITYAVRDVAPDVLIIGNIGLPQLLSMESEPVFKAMEDIDVDAVAIHLNALQEATQPEGETTFARGLEAIKEFLGQSRWPVVVKETGAGISQEAAAALRNVGVEWLDIGGHGGTSFAAVESYRAKDALGKQLAESLSTWGIPTAASLIEVTRATDLKVIASGGLRNGLDVAKCVALGAKCAGMASPFLKALTKSERELVTFVELVASQIIAAMFLTGSRNLEELRSSNLVVGGWLRNWLHDRGIDTSGLSMKLAAL